MYLKAILHAHAPEEVKKLSYIELNPLPIAYLAPLCPKVLIITATVGSSATTLQASPRTNRSASSGCEFKHPPHMNTWLHDRNPVT